MAVGFARHGRWTPKKLEFILLQAIAEALEVNKTLVFLGMSGNDIKDKVLRKKCRARRPNP